MVGSVVHVYEKKIFNSSLTVDPRFLHGNTSSSSRSTANRILSSAFSGRYWPNPSFQSIFGGKYYLPSYVSPQSNTDIFTAYAAITKSRYLQAFALHDQFMTRTASFPKSIGVVDSCLSAANSRKKIDEYLRLNFCESCFFFIPCIKISY